MATVEQLRFIVMLLDVENKQHEGHWFCRLDDAREYVRRNLADKIHYQRAIIGMLVFDPHAKDDSISMVETFGFKNDKKRVEQLDLFK